MEKPAVPTGVLMCEMCKNMTRLLPRAPAKSEGVKVAGAVHEGSGSTTVGPVQCHRLRNRAGPSGGFEPCAR